MPAVAASAPQNPAICQPISVASSEPGPGASRAMIDELRGAHPVMRLDDLAVHVGDGALAAADGHQRERQEDEQDAEGQGLHAVALSRPGRSRRR